MFYGRAMTTRPRSAPVVAIDGPAGAGKSSVSRRVSQELGYLLLDTGALYRSVALSAQRSGADSPAEIGAVARRMVEDQAVRFVTVEDEQRVMLSGEDVTEQVRSNEVGMLASRVSAIPEVREALLAMQRAAGRDGRIVVEGRDIGTVVFPDAEAKFFLTASVSERAARRYAELKSKEPELSLASVEEDVRERDRRDSSRPVSPLVRAPDAIIVDSTDRTFEQVVDDIVTRVRAVEESLTAPPAKREHDV